MSHYNQIRYELCCDLSCVVNSMKTEPPENDHDSHVWVPREFRVCMLRLQQKEDEVNSLKQETARLNKLRETIQRKLRTVEDSKAETEQAREILKSQITALDRGKAS